MPTYNYSAVQAYSAFRRALDAAEKGRVLSQDKLFGDVEAVAERLSTAADAQARAVTDTMMRVTLEPGRYRRDE